MPRCCRAGAARRRSSAPSSPAMPRPASASCRWMKAWTPAPVLARASMPIGAETTAATLHDELAELGARQLLLALAGLAAGTLRREPQPDAGVTYAHKLSKAEVDDRLAAQPQPRSIGRSAPSIPGPSRRRRLDGEVVKLLRSRVAAGRPADRAPRRARCWGSRAMRWKSPAAAACCRCWNCSGRAASRWRRATSTMRCGCRSAPQAMFE